MKFDTMKRILFWSIMLSACTSNNANSDNPKIDSPASPINNQIAQIEPKPQKAEPVKYEIIRRPNDGIGVFDYMFIVYVNKKINHAQTDWIFNDIISKNRGVAKMAIDVWDNKAAFYEELKIYQKENDIYNSGGDLRAFVKEREKVTDKCDKHNIAQYTDNGEEVSKSYPEDKE